MPSCDLTFCRWKKRFAGLGIADLRRLRIIEAENGKFKQLVADLSLGKKMLQDVLSKNFSARGAACSGARGAGGVPGKPNVEPVGLSGFPERLPLTEQASSAGRASTSRHAGWIKNWGERHRFHSCRRQ